MAKPPPTDDFDPKQSIQELSANLNQPDKFAEIFCAAAKSQKRIDEILKENARTVLTTDHEVKTWLQSVIKEHNKADFYFLVKKVGFAGWSLIAFILGGIATAICNTLISKYLN